MSLQPVWLFVGYQSLRAKIPCCLPFVSVDRRPSGIHQKMTPAGVFAGLLVLVAVYCGFDPFKHGAISDFPDFVAHKVEMPAWSEIPVEKDGQNLLQKAEIKFLNQIQGPESMAFDPQGRGPYTGVADGRILFRKVVKWIDFTYTSANSCSGKDLRVTLWREHANVIQRVEVLSS